MNELNLAESGLAGQRTQHFRSNTRHAAGAVEKGKGRIDRVQRAHRPLRARHFEIILSDHDEQRHRRRNDQRCSQKEGISHEGDQGEACLWIIALRWRGHEASDEPHL
jgi:hypothetical protein